MKYRVQASEDNSEVVLSSVDGKNVRSLAIGAEDLKTVINMLAEEHEFLGRIKQMEADRAQLAMKMAEMQAAKRMRESR